MLKRTFALAAVILAGSASSVLAQDKPAAAPATPAVKQPEATPTKPAAPAAPTATLTVGSPAPAIEVEKFVKGSPVTGFEKGRVYVVEFWATWCGPCIASMPHISKLQKQYKDKVTIIGTNIWEERTYSDATFDKVKKFVDEQGDKMGYTVAYDGAAKKMDTNYMKAAGRNGIPSAFVVDQTGTVAWMGHPMFLDAVLADVTAGKWDVKTSPAKLEAAQKTLTGIMRKAATDPKAALADWAAFEKENPGVAEVMADSKLRILMQAGDWAEAYKILNKKADAAIADKDSQALNEIAWNLVDPDAKVEKPDLELAHKAASKAVEITKGEDGAILDTLARVHFLKGETDKAIEIQKKALDKTKDGPMKDQLADTLKEYEAKSKK